MVWVEGSGDTRAVRARMGDGVVSLAGKTALVTGASAGIGRATAMALAAQGARVVVTARREERLREVCAAIEAAGGEAAFFVGDAAEETTARGAIGLAVERFGAVDILINNAGAGSYKNLVDTSAEEYDSLMDANVRSGFVFSRHAAPGMIARGSGVILFVSSVAGLTGIAGESVYSATKFAQVGFSQALDGELRKHGIKVGVICPGGVKSEFGLGRGRTEEFIRNSRMMQPEEVAEAIVYACTLPGNVRIPQMVVRHMG